MLDEAEGRLFSAVQDKRSLVACDECSTPVAEIQNDVLIIRSRHHGDRHLTVIPLKMLDTKGEKV